MQPEDNGYFIYLVRGEDLKNPFDLKPIIEKVKPNDRFSVYKGKKLTLGERLAL